MFVVRQQSALTSVIADVLLAAECSDSSDCDGQVIYLPFPILSG